LGLFVFALILIRDGCGSCSSFVPAPAVGAAGVAWGVIAALTVRGRGLLALGLAAWAFAFHVGLILFSGAPACKYCLFFLVLEGLVTALLSWAEVTADRSKVATVSVVAVSSTSVGVGLALLIFRALIPPMVEREVLNGSASSDLTVYVLVQRNCGHCDAAEKKLAEVLREGLDAKAVVIDVRCEFGSRMIRENKLSTFPAFVAVLSEGMLCAQDGGSVETFQRSIEKDMSKRGLRRPGAARSQ
jgi:hypothetical protein